MRIIPGDNKIFYIAIHPGGSRSSLVINSLKTKLDMIFTIVLLKTDTCSFTSRLLSEDSQSNRLMAFLYDRNLLGGITTQFSRKEEGKNPLNQILQKSFDGGN